MDTYSKPYVTRLICCAAFATSLSLSGCSSVGSHSFFSRLNPFSTEKQEGSAATVKPHLETAPAKQQEKQEDRPEAETLLVKAPTPTPNNAPTASPPPGGGGKPGCKTFCPLPTRKPPAATH